MKAALFVTCLVDGMAPDVGKATVALLRRLGVQVEVPLQQTCCGQMHVNTGYPREALPLVRNHVKAFASYDVIVAPSGSYAASIRHQHPVLARSAADEALAAAAEALASRTYELSEFLCPRRHETWQLRGKPAEQYSASPTTTAGHRARSPCHLTDGSSMGG